MATALGDDWHVVEEGHGGRTTVHADPYDGVHRNGLLILPAILESHRPLDVVAIMLGTNDLKAMFNVSAFEIALSLEKLVKATRHSECGPAGTSPKVLLIAPPPILEVGWLGEMFRGGAEKSRALAGEIEQACVRQNVEFFNADRVASMDPEEGIHFGLESHAALGNAVAEVVRRM